MGGQLTSHAAVRNGPRMTRLLPNQGIEQRGLAAVGLATDRHLKTTRATATGRLQAGGSGSVGEVLGRSVVLKENQSTSFHGPKTQL